ncbi:MAG: sensor histidine kinase [Planctomycetota bacterium]|jgi:signal transduction histidine kinase
MQNRGQAETILVVSHRDDERERLAGFLRRAGHGVRVAASADEALDEYQADTAALVVTARDLPGTDGFALTGLLRARHPEVVVIVLCAAGNVEDTVALMKEGAFHVLSNPTAEQLTVVTAKGLEHVRLSRGNRDLKHQLDISEKLAMIGRLASGVAHELNNPLDGVRRYVRMTREGLDGDEGEYLDRAMNGLGRMAGIVRQLLTFSRNVVIENEAENLRSMLDDVVRTLAPSGSARACVTVENPYVDIRAPKALFQVFANLLKNALDAVEEQGARGTVDIAVAREGESFRVAVRDNGTGIEEADLRRVFEPFFTTKEVGKGTGLGLPISARIVERCGGKISVESDPDTGTTVTVSVPLGAPVAAGAAPLHGVKQR